MEEQGKDRMDELDTKIGEETDKTSWLSRKSTQDKLINLFIYICLILGGIIICIPFFWMVSTSLKVPGREFVFPIEWIPNPVRWQNFQDLLKRI